LKNYRGTTNVRKSHSQPNLVLKPEVLQMNNNNQAFTRRQFIKTTGSAAIAAPIMLQSSSLSGQGNPPGDHPPISPPSGPATGSCNGLHRESNFLAIEVC
jgi:hypothetical protein